MGDTIPDVIINICRRAGYDNALAILDFDVSDIKTIEEHTEQYSRDILNESDIYSDVRPFVFKPGHKKLLLTLPNKIHGFKNCKSRKNLFNSTKLEASKPFVEKVVEEVELLTESEISDLREKLIDKINYSVRVCGLQAVFSTAEVVTDIEPYISHSLKNQKKPSYKCHVKCALCEKLIPCTHNSHWQISNLDRHLKNHLNNPSACSETSSEIEKSKNNIQQIANHREVNRLLELTDDTNVLTD